MSEVSVRHLQASFDHHGCDVKKYCRFTPICGKEKGTSHSKVAENVDDRSSPSSVFARTYDSTSPV
jgi:hypothetical protein